MKVLVTGASGFIGSWVTQELLNKGHEVSVLIRNKNKVPSLNVNPNIKVFEGDLNNYDMMEQALVAQEACVHIALGWGETPTTMLKNDTLATMTLLELSHKLGLKKFIHTSSTAAIGDIRPVMNEDITLRPVDLYGATKAASENFIMGFSAKNADFKANIIRPSYTFGNPVWSDSYSQPDQRFVEMIKKIKTNQDLNLIKYDGTQFTWVGDLAKVYSSVLESDYDRKVFHGISGEFVSWQEIAEIAIELSDSKSKIIIDDLGWSNDPAHYGVKEIKKCFGYDFKAKFQLSEHVKHLLDSV